MKYAFYPGCVSRGACPELYTATLAVCEILEIELDEAALEGASCTGAGVLQEKNEKTNSPISSNALLIDIKIELIILYIIIN